MKQEVNFRSSKVVKETYTGSMEQEWESLKDSAQLKEYQAYRNRVKDNRWNPAFHFYAPDGVINDPNGLCYWKGNYHLFYQAYPPADNVPTYDRLHWGHAVSSDLVHWKDLPIALYPDVEYACWSGATVVDDDKVVAMYHGRWKGSMIATSSDPLLLNWEKIPEAVIPILPNQNETNGHPYSMFDPCIWKDETGYYSLSGGLYGQLEERGKNYHNVMVEHLFHSQDLKHWSYMGELSPEGFPGIAKGNDGACPYFWPIGNRQILFTFSHWTGAYATLGDFDLITHRFTPDRTFHFNIGPLNCSSFQAPCAYPDGNGGIYLLFNVKDALKKLERKGGMSMVYHVTLRGENDLNIQPIEQLDSLHGEQFSLENIIANNRQEMVLPITGNQLDIHMNISLKDAKALQIRVLRSKNAEEHTDINLYMPSGIKIPTPYIAIDTLNASLSDDVMARIPESASFNSCEDERVDLRILIDRSIIEVFANEQAIVMQMVYPTLQDSQGISLTSIGGDALIEKMDIWKMNSIY